MAYKPKTLAVVEGGTSLTTLTAHALYVGNGTSAPTALAVASTGKVLQGNTGADPSFSTATYPSTATTTGQILRADGTNWSGTTATYPNTAGTSANVLASDGTNFVSSTPPGGLLTLTGSLTNAQIKALHGTPIQVLATPGSGKVICIQQIQAKMVYGGNNVFVAGAAQTINFYYGTSTSIGIALTNANIVAAATQFGTASPVAVTGANTVFDNIAVNLFNPIATEITGNAAGDNTITWRIVYCVVAI